MRNIVITVVCSLALAACSGSSESYNVGSSDAYYKLAGSGYSGGIYPLPSGLVAMNVNLAFSSIPTDQTAYWSFTRNGKELGRVNAVVEGDSTSSKISYNYAKGEGAASDEKIERLVRVYMPQLISETVDAKIENRPYDTKLKEYADAMTLTSTVSNVMKGVNSAMDKSIRDSDESRARADADSAARSAQYTSTRPTTDLSKY